MSIDPSLPEDLAELLRRRAATEDAARPVAIERRHGRGGRTARENVVDLIDDGSWVEYGRYVVAAQRGRRDIDDLIANTPADGLVAGTATAPATRPPSWPMTTRCSRGPRVWRGMPRGTACSS